MDPSQAAAGDQRLRLRDGADRSGANHNASGASGRASEPAVLVLRGLRSQRQAERAAMRVSWVGNTRDNRLQRVSKCCCMFHKKRNFGESDSSSSDSGGDSEDDFLGGFDENGLPAVLPGAAAGAAAAAAAASPSTSRAGGDDEADSGDHGSHNHHHHDADGGCCETEKKHKHRGGRPACTKESCYCGTRFS